MDPSPQHSQATAAEEDIASANARLGIGVALHRQGLYAEAAEAFRQATAANPGSAQAWGNLAVALALCGRNDESLDAAARATTLAPRVAMLQSNHGDALMATGRFEAAREAYGRADALHPDHPATLNKLACAQRMLGEIDRPDTLLRRAVALAPQFALALVNLGALEAVRGDYGAAVSLLDRALAAPGLPADARDSATTAMSLVGEHRRLRPALQDAIERDDPGALASAVAATPDSLLVADAAHLARLEAIARALRAVGGEDEIAAAGAAPASWPAIEAHFTTHGDAAAKNVRATIDRLETGAASMAFADDARVADLLRIARAVERRRARRDPRAPADGRSGEALLRFWHAALTWHRPECAPGQFKLLPNLTAATPSHRFIAPFAVVGTLRRFFNDIYPTVPPGLARAILVARAIASSHPFIDGNGRVARFLLNAELEAAALHPVVFFPDLRVRWRAAIAAERGNVDPSGFVAILRDAGRRTAELMRVLQASA
ncbi:MAG: tetratricopeptide repeat protein [Casimicrobiaceae bacterium]